MNEETLKQAIKAKLSKREIVVLLAQELGYVELYDIQQLTGYKKVEIQAAFAQIKQHRGLYNINKSIFTAQIKQTTLNPPQLILKSLSSALQQDLPPTPTNLSGCKKIYEKAFRLKKDQAEAIQLVEDCIETSDFTRAKMPVFYLTAVFNSYAPSIPKEYPVAVWERIHYKNETFRYNNNTKAWERRWRATETTGNN